MSSPAWGLPRRPGRGPGRLDLNSEPVPSVRKAQQLVPIFAGFHLLGEGSALIGVLAVLRCFVHCHLHQRSRRRNEPSTVATAYPHAEVFRRTGYDGHTHANVFRRTGYAHADVFRRTGVSGCKGWGSLEGRR
jgi:hypothetical protein